MAAEALRAAIHAAYDDPGSDAALVGELYRTVGELALVVDRHTARANPAPGPARRKAHTKTRRFLSAACFLRGQLPSGR
ncbi:hypothetical protein BH24ACT5_BH24ACT5_04830 [soil metagenome]